MLRQLVCTAALAFPLLGCSPARDEAETPPPAEAAEEAIVEPLPAHLDSQIADYLEQYGRNWPSFRFHGVILVARGNEIGIHRAFGLADLSSEVPNEASTHFRIGTMSAQFIAAAIMVLVDDGKLSLSDPLGKYLPDYPNGKSITVEHLLTHTSGVPNFTDMGWFVDAKHTPTTSQQLIERFRPYKLEHAPGEETTPSNSNYVLLAAVIEKVTGSPFETFVAAHVLTPLAMNATHFGTTEDQQAVGLEFNEAEHLDPVRGVHPGSLGAAGGYVSTARDLLAFNRGLTNGRLLTEEARDRMMGRLESDVGYAWVTNEVRGRTVSGWPGIIDGINCSVLNVANDDTVVIVLANTEVVSAGGVAQDILAMVYGGEPPVYDEHREISEPLVKQVSALGHYTITRKTEEMIAAVDPAQLDSLAEIDVVLRKDHLVLEISGHGNKRMHALGNGRFFFKDLPRTTAQYSALTDGKGRLVLVQPGGAELVFLRKRSP
ncbi:MAG: beta-lactamase family protein [Nannocystaceae bacterium]|nr:beta-lactamase family protein [Nannocystaceae bacterium]